MKCSQWMQKHWIYFKEEILHTAVCIMLPCLVTLRYKLHLLSEKEWIYRSPLAKCYETSVEKTFLFYFHCIEKLLLYHTYILKIASYLGSTSKFYCIWKNSRNASTVKRSTITPTLRMFYKKIFFSILTYHLLQDNQAIRSKVKFNILL